MRLAKLPTSLLIVKDLRIWSKGLNSSRNLFGVKYWDGILQLLRSPGIGTKGSDSAILCSLAGRCDNPFSYTRFHAPIDCFKIPALLSQHLWTFKARNRFQGIDFASICSLAESSAWIDSWTRFMFTNSGSVLRSAAWALDIPLCNISGRREGPWISLYIMYSGELEEVACCPLLFLLHLSDHPSHWALDPAALVPESLVNWKKTHF
jgi:hypothetical protein